MSHVAEHPWDAEALSELVLASANEALLEGDDEAIVDRTVVECVLRIYNVAPVSGRNPTAPLRSAIGCRRSTLVAERFGDRQRRVRRAPPPSPRPPTPPGSRSARPIHQPMCQRVSVRYSLPWCSWPTSESRTRNCCRPAEDGRRQNSGVRRGKVEE